jgi:hypothetical protein
VLERSEGITSEGITSEGITSEGITSEGITSEGITSEGITSEGITSEGIASQLQEVISPAAKITLRWAAAELKRDVGLVDAGRRRREDVGRGVKNVGVGEEIIG